MNTLKMLAIDLGASSGRGIVGSFDGKKLARRALWGGDVVDVLTWCSGVLPRLTLSPMALAHIPSHPVAGPRMMPFSL